MVDLRVGNDVDLDEFIGAYVSSTLGERRPVDDRERMAAMLANANLVVSAWDGDRLVGVARSISDFAYATYVSDLAVDRSYQRRGIGRALLARTQREGAPARLVLLSAPAAVDYYPRIGMKPYPSAWTLDADQPLDEQ